jgi:Holliday junction resolvasome RuvABC DNA-binding subunit
MRTILVEVKDNAGMKILQDLESAKIIRLIIPGNENKALRLSERLRGSITKKTAQEMHNELNQMRGEWQQHDI